MGVILKIYVFPTHLSMELNLLFKTISQDTTKGTINKTLFFSVPSSSKVQKYFLLISLFLSKNLLSPQPQQISWKLTSSPFKKEKEMFRVMSL